MKYTSKDTPMRYGIMYTEDPTRSIETAWYETKDERIGVRLDIERTGMLSISHSGYPLGKQVSIYAFSEIDASFEYYTRNKE